MIRIVSDDRERVLSLTLPDVARDRWNPAKVAAVCPPRPPIFRPPRICGSSSHALAGLGLLAEWYLFGGGRRPSVFRSHPASAAASQPAAALRIRRSEREIWFRDDIRSSTPDSVGLPSAHLGSSVVASIPVAYWPGTESRQHGCYLAGFERTGPQPPKTRTATAILVDTSGSVSDADLSRASSLVQTMSRAKGGNWIKIVPFDSRTHSLPAGASLTNIRFERASDGSAGATILRTRCSAACRRCPRTTFHALPSSVTAMRTRVAARVQLLSCSNSMSRWTHSRYPASRRVA